MNLDLIKILIIVIIMFILDPGLKRNELWNVLLYSWYTKW